MTDCEKADILVPNQCTEISTTITDRLNSRKRRLELELSDTNAALKALEDHPEVAQVLTLVGKTLGRSL